MTDPQRHLFETRPDPWVIDGERSANLARVVFAEGIREPLDYRVPESLREATLEGKRVRVPLGRGNRLRTGYCVQVRSETQVTQRLKDVVEVLDAVPLVSPALLRLTRWMADYYLTSWGRALEGVIPAGVRGQAGTRVETVYSLPTRTAARWTQLQLPAKQLAVIQSLLAAGRPLTSRALQNAAGCRTGPIKALLAKGLIETSLERIQPAVAVREPIEPHQSLTLNPAQRQAVDAVVSALQSGEHRTFVLHGVTGSGKTEVYIRAIEEMIQFRRQAIVLVPEISLTPQTQRRFRARFPGVAVLHSHLSDRERNWHWQRIARGEVQVIVGARSAMFAPTPHLGLIILDEEHDASFKQDSVPRYHARDVARRRAEAESIPLILGSATPSLESWRLTQTGGAQLLSMPERILDRPLPEVVIVDLRQEFQHRFQRGPLSRRLQHAISRALAAGEQVILLLNRRGFSTHIQCPACGYVVSCPACDLALTHHREGERAICHYCDYTVAAPPICPECRFEGIRYGGLGTQRLEAEIRARFPQAAVLRMDSDTMRRPGSHEESLSRFRRGEIQILLGTQMIAKGLDFPNVTVVGVINADTALHLPDFRAAERTFQLVTQVAGRTGRGEKGGRVFVQTYNPDHPAILAAERHDYRRFAAQELPAREQFGYPPFGSMVRVIVRGPQEKQVEQVADELAEQLVPLSEICPGFRLLGPAPAPMPRLRGLYRYHLLVQAAEAAPIRDVLRKVQSSWALPDDIQWLADVDPLDML